jgi:hypothetical protein
MAIKPECAECDKPIDGDIGAVQSCPHAERLKQRSRRPELR